MNLTIEEKRALGKSARQVSRSSGSIITWRWLNAIAPFRPRSRAELYTTALRRLRHQTAMLLEAEEYAGSCADWLLTQCLCAEEDERILRRLQQELSISASQARSCLDRIRAFWSGLPCSQPSAWEELGHYAWAEHILRELTRSNEEGSIPAQLQHPVSPQRLTAVSDLAFTQSYGATCGDITAEARLADQFLIRKSRLMEPLTRHLKLGLPAPVFWNLPAFFDGVKSAADLAEMQSCTDLLSLVKALVVVEYHIRGADGVLDDALTNALCNIFWMLLGHLDPRDLQTMSMSVSLSCPVKSIALPRSGPRRDYVQALFHMGLSELLPPGTWMKPALFFFRTSLALPKMKLSVFEWASLAFLAFSMIHFAITQPRGAQLVLLFTALLIGCYIVMRGGIRILTELLMRTIQRLVERYPVLMLILVVVLSYVLLKYY